MFLRKITVRKDGKRHEYWALVESVRTERGPRHHVVAYLGDMDIRGRLQTKASAEGRAPNQPGLFDEPPPEYVEIDVRKVRLERSRRFGDVWLAVELMKRLKLGELFDRLLPESSEENPLPGRPPKIP